MRRDLGAEDGLPDRLVTQVDALIELDHLDLYPITHHQALTSPAARFWSDFLHILIHRLLVEVDRGELDIGKSSRLRSWQYSLSRPTPRLHIQPRRSGYP